MGVGVLNQSRADGEKVEVILPDCARFADTFSDD